MALNLFSGGYLPLEQRSMAENLFWAICHKIQRLTKQMEFVPEELEGLDAMLSATPTSAIFRCSSRCPTVGPSSSCSR